MGCNLLACAKGRVNSLKGHFGYHERGGPFCFGRPTRAEIKVPIFPLFLPWNFFPVVVSSSFFTLLLVNMSPSNGRTNPNSRCPQVSIFSPTYHCLLIHLHQCFFVCGCPQCTSLTARNDPMFAKTATPPPLPLWVRRVLAPGFSQY